VSVDRRHQSPGGSIFVSVQQLGLNLGKQKVPIKTIIVDSTGKNSEN